MESCKVFGIGLSKTSTTSLSKALRQLGYRSLHYPFESLYMEKGELKLDYSYFKDFDAAADSPIPMFYKELDRKYSGSSFIFTARDIDSWLESCRNHFTRSRAFGRVPFMGKAMSKYIEQTYGSQVFDRETFRNAYLSHKENVERYFSERSEDILMLDTSNGEGWNELCAFLGKAFPDVLYPAANKKSHPRNKFPLDTFMRRIKHVLS